MSNLFVFIAAPPVVRLGLLVCLDSHRLNDPDPGPDGGPWVLAPHIRPLHVRDVLVVGLRSGVPVAVGAGVGLHSKNNCLLIIYIFSIVNICILLIER